MLPPCCLILPQDPFALMGTRAGNATAQRQNPPRPIPVPFQSLGASLMLLSCGSMSHTSPTLPVLHKHHGEKLPMESRHFQVFAPPHTRSPLEAAQGLSAGNQQCWKCSNFSSWEWEEHREIPRPQISTKNYKSLSSDTESR